MDISFIIPAHNEFKEIGACLKTVFEAGAREGRPFEVIVVDDASSDGTGETARQAGAQVISVNKRQISAVRNAGAKAANGQYFFFVDADTRISPDTLRAALKVLDRGVVGGGAHVSFSEPLTFAFEIAMELFSFMYMRLLRWAPGCFLFARRDAFEAVGGFDETLFACEEIGLSRALKRQGSFVILRERVLTSARKLRMHSPCSIFPLLCRLIFRGPAIFHRREGLDWWYDGRRE